MKKRDDKTNDCCPNCGHCPHCGRSDRRAPMIPAPYPVPVPMRPYPYPRPYWYGEGRIYSGGDSTAPPPGFGQTISINCAATC